MMTSIKIEVKPIFLVYSSDIYFYCDN